MYRFTQITLIRHQVFIFVYYNTLQYKLYKTFILKLKKILNNHCNSIQINIIRHVVKERSPWGLDRLFLDFYTSNQNIRLYYLL